MLHLQYKTEYFVEEEWKKAWIDTAKDILTDEWDNHYWDTVRVGEEVPRVVSIMRLYSCSLTNVPCQIASRDDIFATLDRRTRTAKTTECAAYMREDPIKQSYAKDALQYWSQKAADGDRFARMALDFESAPGELVTAPRYI